MAAIESSGMAGAGLRAAVPQGRHVDADIVWLRGEHDLSTTSVDSAILATAIGRNNADLLVDLSEVGFMDSSTVRTLMNARTFLGGRSRSLTLRAPSRCAALVLRATGMETSIGVQAAPELC